ncbi:myosin H [Cardiosporidium cionae]|uniref:Myosin H n=1 Tax=Cardiosporidium cionae TaxID=476202 RepID=A0ABQ7J9H8_9APIC|nr:myosin H [Cardiosporidium cionae]|eukprot:KAF8820300.1 myosin H [Cardiosporidium cionae]
MWQAVSTRPSIPRKMQRKYSGLDVGEHIVGSTVWIKSATESIYREVAVKAVSGNVVTVNVDGATQEVDASECLNSNVAVEPHAIYDLAKLTHANEAAALDVIKKRYMKDEIYETSIYYDFSVTPAMSKICVQTYAGRLLVVMNPFKLIKGLYEPKCLTKYQASEATHGFPTDVPPHTYAVAQVAMNTMKSTKECQSCISIIIPSGESGAGKTETARHLMQYFASVKVQIGGKKAIQDVILGANPLLEAIGNAKTTRNNNSSRFGRFVKLEVPEAGGICGGSISSYMLELSRVEFQATNERNYHIFYQLIKALPQKVKDNIKLKEAEEYNFLNQSGCYEVSTVNDVEEFKLVQRQLDLILSDDEKMDYFKALSAILLAGNINYEDTQAMGTDKAGKVTNWNDFEIVTNLLGIGATPCDKAITTTTVTIGGSVIESASSAEQAKIVCKAIAKEVYSICFEFFIKRINKLIYFDDDNKLWIGILDIYGFEFFEKNSYEQFLINYANEKLQQFFIQQVFQAEKAEYEVEGIDHSMITYSDNAEVILVRIGLEIKCAERYLIKPQARLYNNCVYTWGINITEQCLLQTGTSLSFTSACHKNIKNPHFSELKGDIRYKFKIIHTAAPVLYNTEEFVAKNKHKCVKIPNEICEIMKNSTNSTIKAAYEDYEIIDSKNMRGKFVGSKFQKSMGNLMLNLKKTNAHFIRCVKPNQQKAPLLFDAQTTLGQLICLSVFEAIGIIHKGFAYRSTFEEFVQNNSILMNVIGAQTDGSDVKAACISMLERIMVPKDQWQLGLTKIFIRKDGWLLIDRYFRQIMTKLSPLVIKLQSIYRAWKNRQDYEWNIKMTVRVQSLYRYYNARKDQVDFESLKRFFIGSIILALFSNVRQRQETAATKIQKVYKGYLARKRYTKLYLKFRVERLKKEMIKFTGTTVAARRWKLHAASKREERCAIKIQCAWRQYYAKKCLAILEQHKKENMAAILIQKNWLGHKARIHYQMLRYLNICCITIQRYWRGYLVRTSPEFEKIRGKIEGIRQNIKEIFATQQIHNFMRTYLISRRLHSLEYAVDILQSFARTKLLHERMKQILRATVCIQSWWRMKSVQRILHEEKFNIILGGVNQIAASWTRKECQRIHSLIKGRRGIEGLMLVHVSTHVPPKTVYPYGWTRGIEHIFAMDPSASIKSIDIGAFHTVVYTSTGHLYSFGLNDRYSKCTASLNEANGSILILLQAHCPIYYPFPSRNQLGIPSSAGLALPEHSISRHCLPISVKAVYCGVDHTLALSEEGLVFAWGSNTRFAKTCNRQIDT